MSSGLFTVILIVCMIGAGFWWLFGGRLLEHLIDLLFNGIKNLFNRYWGK